MTTYNGSCHCSSITVSFETSVPAADTEVRLCQCRFCRSHGAKAISDPAGKIQFTEKVPQSLKRYSFALKTAEFLICRDCGVYVGAAMHDGDKAYGIVNIRALKDEALFSREPAPAIYDGEETSERMHRRRKRWTPTDISTT